MVKLDKETTGILVIDMQEKVMSKVERSCDTALNALKLINGARILQMPIVATEQYPEGLGKTIPAISAALNTPPLAKTTFSCMGNDAIQEVLNLPNWIIVGIEAHVCVLQTAKDLLEAGMNPVVLNDAISSRSIFDYSTAIAEMRDLGIRVSSVETVLFELIKDSKHESFKQISNLIKCSENSCSCG
ncbi:MAG: isochorismatase family protein [Waddliaceae bacterium]